MIKRVNVFKDHHRIFSILVSFCIWGIDRLSLHYLFFYLGHLLSQLSSIFSLHGGWLGEWPGGKVATWWALQSLEHLLSMDFKALNSVWWSCELRSALQPDCELVIGLQYIIAKYNPELFSWLWVNVQVKRWHLSIGWQGTGELMVNVTSNQSPCFLFIHIYKTFKVKYSHTEWF